MGRIRRTFVRAALLTGATVAGWNLLLDEPTREKVRDAATRTKLLAQHLVGTYLETERARQEAYDEDAARNRAWVEEQWRRAGF